MSGRSYSDYSSTLRSSVLRDDSERVKETRVRRESLKGVRAEEVDYTKFDKKTTAKREKARLVIKKPSAQANYLVAVDASASNDEISRHVLQCGGFLLAPFGALGLSTSFGFVFFSDHGDPRPEQDIDFIMPSEQGDDALLASMGCIETQNGDDIPEMIECVMERAATKLPLEGTNTKFVLVTDSVAHGMGLARDQKCPYNVKWKEALAKVRQVFSGFVLIGCTNTDRYPAVSELQAKFFQDEKDRAMNFIDLSSVADTGDRQRLVVNALQFVAMRDEGPEKVELYFKALYDKLLAEGLRGQDTDANARDRISRFMKYLDITEAEKNAMLIRIFGD